MGRGEERIFSLGKGNNSDVVFTKGLDFIIFGAFVVIKLFMIFSFLGYTNNIRL